MLVDEKAQLLKIQKAKELAKKEEEKKKFVERMEARKKRREEYEAA